MRFILTTEISWKPNTFMQVYFEYPSALLSIWCRHSRIDFFGNNYMVYLTILCCSLYWSLVKNSIIANNSFLFGFWPRCSIYIFKLVTKMCEIGYLNRFIWIISMIYAVLNGYFYIVRNSGSDGKQAKSYQYATKPTWFTQLCPLQSQFNPLHKMWNF